MNKKERKPFRVTTINQNNETIVTLERPFIIHWPAPSIKNPSKRHARKTFAVNFANDTIFITAARGSKKDQFSRKIGRKVALGRLEKLVTSYFENNMSISGTFALSNPYCRIVNVAVIDANKDGVFKSCSIPGDIVAYILDIYNRLQRQVAICG